MVYSKVVFVNIDRPSCETFIWYLDETCHVIVDCTVQKHNQKPNRLVCICFSMMSFVFAPVVKIKPNLPNAFTSMTLSTTPPPPPKKKRDCTCLLFYLFFLVLVFHYHYFWLGFSLRCEPKDTRDFAEVTKMAHVVRTKSIFRFRLQFQTEKSDLLVYLHLCPGLNASIV